MKDKKFLCIGSSDCGGVIPLVAVVILVLLQSLSFAIDLGNAYVEQRKIHIAADAAALAGVAVYANVPGAIDSVAVAEASIVPEAREIANANGLSDQELVLGGGIIPGNWDPAARVFTARTPPLNAVRVLAGRNVPTFFARLFNWDFLQPKVYSTARIGGANRVQCAVPFGIDDDLLVGKEFGDVIFIGRESPGNWGKLDIGDNMSDGGQFEESMIEGICDVRLSVGDAVSPGTGFAGVRSGFDGRIEVNPIVIIPIVDEFHEGNSVDSIIMGFIAVEIISNGNRGAHWNGNIRLIDANAGTGTGGPLGPPFATSRVLVE